MRNRGWLTVLVLVILPSFWLACGAPESKVSPVEGKDEIMLPEPRYESGVSIEETLRKRRSVREYADEALTLPEVAQLLWAAQGITSPGGKRTVPSAGALYPLEVYVVIGKVAGVTPGVYSYRPQSHKLAKVRDGEQRAALCQAALAQESVEQAAIDIVITAVYERTTITYGDRGLRYVHMEAGHAAQNVYLQAEALGLGTVVIGAFLDEPVKRVLGLPEDEEPLYIIPVGRKI